MYTHDSETGALSAAYRALARTTREALQGKKHVEAGSARGDDKQQMCPVLLADFLTTRPYFCMIACWFQSSISKKCLGMCKALTPDVFV